MGLPLFLENVEKLRKSKTVCGEKLGEGGVTRVICLVKYNWYVLFDQ